ncbi:MAG: FlxA-like family protein [Blautia sp.]|nr:FlxA-like family protein [Blautia sp.]MCM1199979.1 FlxA-like family protein [Bacteroides fragilis]
MVINGVNGIDGAGMWAGTMGKGQAEDAVSKRLQQQIDAAQKKLQEISANSGMSVEEKMKMRQAIQKEIADLKSQLQQHQMELRQKEMEDAKRKQAEKASASEEPAQAKSVRGKEDSVDVQISAEGMQAMLSAGEAVKLAKVQGSVANAMEGRANVLETEIKLDSARNGDTSAKEAQLADVEQKAQKAVSSQIGTLADAGKALEADKTSVSAAGARREEEKESEEAEEKKEREEDGSAVYREEEGNADSGVF